ncbi:cryptochrome/photolyase family protein [Sandaracinobacteroides saxicola]|uniref:Cryptochrome/photolyase family protein n=1 Tax=Sandaracinobacteroides saxicola TaxID=2759707 RepID=A0A7G5IH42_9SPHN|nr:cryptochrome/photolyase family protein [Sandaracinobacteroides saxicola]QMW22684.1 cryptochrome/photolyase family protein [Sandaracinobacteroides saxicola]
MSGPLILPVLGDQLSPGLASLRGVAKDDVVLLLAEVADETRYVPHHKQKLVLVLSAMRHFADEMRGAGWRVDYRALEDAGNSGSLTGELVAAVARHGARGVRATAAGEHRVCAMQGEWAGRLPVPVEILPDDRFIVSRAAFDGWARGRKLFRMEDFYRWQRRETGILMDGDAPVGGKWNYDAENRKKPPKGTDFPVPPRFAPDDVTREVVTLVERRFADHFGTLDAFNWPVTRAQALEALDHFIAARLPWFGDYQDAMIGGQPTMFHALVSTSINLGLLDPREVIDVAVAAYERGTAPLNAVEGFVRQILGWREYVRGIYFHAGPDYVRENALGATRDLPWIYWGGDSGMACFDAAFAQTRDLAYAHHIQRLMVLGNFALLAGVDPHQLHEWFLVVYADAYEWVEAPNVIGMSQFADGGLLGSKPYAAGGAYINRMGDHCRGCRYDVKAKAGETACPFNYLYWDFLARHEERLSKNQRLWTVYDGWRRFSAARQAEIRSDAARFLATLGG